MSEQVPGSMQGVGYPLNGNTSLPWKFYRLTWIGPPPGHNDPYGFVIVARSIYEARDLAARNTKDPSWMKDTCAHVNEAPIEAKSLVLFSW